MNSPDKAAALLTTLPGALVTSVTSSPSKQQDSITTQQDSPTIYIIIIVVLASLIAVGTIVICSFCCKKKFFKNNGSEEDIEGGTKRHPSESSTSYLKQNMVNQNQTESLLLNGKLPGDQSLMKEKNGKLPGDQSLMKGMNGVSVPVPEARSLVDRTEHKRYEQLNGTTRPENAVEVHTYSVIDPVGPKDRSQCNDNLYTSDPTGRTANT
jgi:hypothetical protein